jgi:predicted helicase
MDIVGQWSHVLIFDRPISHHAVSSKEVNFIFPLFLYQDETRQENISAEFRSFLDERYAHHYAPEEILAYIYSVLYSPTYRNRYADFLRIDFPRIPFADSREDFDALSLLGWELIEAHLLRNVPSRGLGKFTGKGDREVVAVTYGEVEQKVHINKDQSFGPVPEDVWRFTIGGYQVLDKYLKSRKGRSLCLDEIKHVAKVADCLSFTIDQMKRIDEAWCRAFPEQN